MKVLSENIKKTILLDIAGYLEMMHKQDIIVHEEEWGRERDKPVDGRVLEDDGVICSQGDLLHGFDQVICEGRHCCLECLGCAWFQLCLPAKQLCNIGIGQPRLLCNLIVRLATLLFCLK